MRPDFFQRLPPPTAILLLSSIFELTSAHVLHMPRQTPAPTTTIPSNALNVQSWYLVATPAPRNPFDLFRRQDTNTICGYIGGNSALPATCSAGSHCVVDNDHNVIGCCPDGAATCTSGVYTACVDANSPSEAIANHLVYTCSGSDVCYKNVFDGGHSQFGCGTASDLATTVLATASGITSSLTRSTIGSTSSTSSSTRSTTSSSSSSSSSSTSSTSTTRGGPPGAGGGPTNRPGPGPGPGANSEDRIGPIVGGTIGGVSVFLALCAFAIFFFRRKRQNKRTALGVDTYLSPPKSGADGFTPIHQSNEAFESGVPAHAVPPGGGLPMPVWAANMNPNGPSPFAYHGAAGPHTSYPPVGVYHYPGQFPGAYAGAGTPVIVTGGPAGAGIAMMATGPPVQTVKNGGSEDQVPLTGQQQGLGRIGEEDEDRERGGTGTTEESNGNEGRSPETTSPGGQPLWQQNRRQSRNQVWM
ncbi:hypothetical protein OQA88_11094 [Cercophora sp. LCS_1]